MLASPARKPPAHGEWAVEIKWDGVRAMAYCREGEVTLESRAGNPFDDRFPELAQPGGPAAVNRSLVLDGEIVAFDARGLPSFARLQRRLHHRPDEALRNGNGLQDPRAGVVAVYLIFDIVHRDGKDLFDWPYIERRQLLEELDLSGPNWQVPDYEIGDSAGLLDASRHHGLEGLVLKRLSSRYEPGRRSGAWLKLKNLNRREFVIGGWLPGEGQREGRIGALLVGAWEDEPKDSHSGGGRRLRYMGRVGTGFSEEWLALLAGELGPLWRATTPFDRPLPREAVHAEPQLVAEIEFREVTADGMLRHSSFKGLRPDKPAAEVTWEGADATAERAEP